MKLVLDTPRDINVSDTRTITIDQWEVQSLSFNLRPDLTSKDPPEMLISAVLLHRASGYQKNVLIQNADAYAWWKERSDDLLTALFSKLMDDGHVTAGTVIPTDAKGVAIDPAPDPKTP